jgi:gamma-glutamyltranspeptidase/glutathione hydrolase
MYRRFLSTFSSSLAPLLVTGLLVLSGAACVGEGSSLNEDSDADQVVFPAQNRPDVRGTMGAVSADHPLAAAAGYAVLRRGGTAADAVVAMAGVLAVVRPHMNGVGGAAFAIFYDGGTGEVAALNGSGRSGGLATPGFFQDNFDGEIPSRGPGSVSVPGAVAAWVDALERFGTMELSELLAPAIGYAREGFPVSTRLAQDIEAQGRPLNPVGKELYLPGGAPPPLGSLLKNPALARTLDRIAQEGKSGFYGGPVAAASGPQPETVTEAGR